MEVRHAVLVGVVLLLGHPQSAWAQGAGPSSTAAFPDPAPQPGSGAVPRPSFPSPVPAPTRAPAPAPYQYSQYPQYPPQAQWPTYTAPAPATPQGGYTVPGYQPGWGTNAYGAGPHANEPQRDQKTETNEKPTRYVSLTLSPVHLALPVFEATLEVRPTEHLGIAAIGGLGDAPPSVVGQNLVETDDRFAVREIGAQLLIYPFSNFDGFVIGGELLSVKVSGSTTVNTQSVDVTGSALALGPLLGGKWIHESGFTLFGHLGAQRLWLNADSASSGRTVNASDSRWFPLVNLNAGWSF
jgi:hypothetical protein